MNGFIMAGKRWLVLAAGLLTLLCLDGCSSSSSSSSQVTLEGTRFGAQLIRAADENDWVTVTGTQEWWIFNGGVFRQVSSDYVEPEFYGENEACNGEGTGTYTEQATNPDGTTPASNVKNLALSYDGLLNVTGVCRMTNRTLTITLQPSGAVDVLDNKRVQRLAKIQAIQ